MSGMNSIKFPGAENKPHDGVGHDGSMRVGPGTGELRRTLSNAEIAETAGGPRPYKEIDPLTIAVRRRIEDAANA